MNRRGLTCVETTVLVIVLGILAALIVPAILRARGGHHHPGCANNLAQLWKMQWNYSVQYGGSAKRMPEETGEAFWLKLSQPPTVLIDSTLTEIYQCPLTPPDRGCDYRGPSSDVNRYGDGDPVGADIEGNHGADGGNVLRKSGDVMPVGKGDALWELARGKTTGGTPASPAPEGPSEERKTPPWMIGTIFAFMVSMLGLKFFRPPRVEPRSLAFWTAFLGLGGAALLLMM